MDPKALSHLDPKARETYDRIMGTAANTNPVPDQPPAENQGVPTNDFSTPTPTDPTMNSTDQMGVPPTGQTTYNSDLGQIVPTSAAADPSQMSDMGMAGASPSIFSTPPSQDPVAPVNPADTGNGAPTSPNSAFFINPSPATSEMPAASENPQAYAPVEPPHDPLSPPMSPDPMAPVTPYAPESAAPVDASASTFAQPLPSPADVSQQTATHETSPLLKVLYIVGAVIFFAIYTIFWIKVFNLPFLF